MLVELEERHLGYPNKNYLKLKNGDMNVMCYKTGKLESDEFAEFLENQRSCIKKMNSKGYINNSFRF